MMGAATILVPLQIPRSKNMIPCESYPRHDTNKGYGAALISGFRNARYEQVFFTDGDNQFHMSEIELLLKKIGEADGVLGFRKNRKDPWHRIWYSRLWNWLVRVMFDRRVKDLNCAFKIAHTKYLV